MSNIQSLRNKYKNKRMFVIGNGPSLNKTPINRLKNEHSIAMNRISLIYKKTDWRPTFFVCTTTNIHKKDWKKDILKTIDMGVTSFVWDRFRPIIGNRKNVYYINCTDGNNVTNNPNIEWWSNDISKRVSKFGTSMLVALQVASYMGFNPIYILGADLGFEEVSHTPFQSIIKKHLPRMIKTDVNHFAPEYGTPGLGAKQLNENMVAAHKLAFSNFKKNKIKVYNATVGGSLEVYPRKDIYKLV